MTKSLEKTSAYVSFSFLYMLNNKKVTIFIKKKIIKIETYCIFKAIKILIYYIVKFSKI